VTENKSENKSPAGEGGAPQARTQGDDPWRAPTATPTPTDADADRRRRLRTRWIVFGVLAAVLLATFVAVRATATWPDPRETAYRAGYDFVTHEMAKDPSIDGMTTTMAACRLTSARMPLDEGTAALRGCSDALRADTDRRYGR
jgi:hypothetical protein